ncbi:MAG TPA: VOC family protein [Candidatus Saccharimonadales bacterium]|nr:VOC family protein [Candidatus Saccharimonadales bacterium]
MQQKIIPFFWFDNQAEEAANYYVALFPDSKINKIVRYPKAADHVSPQGAGAVMTVDLELSGMKFTFLNGGKNDAFLSQPGPVSFVVSCDTQEEIDKYWAALTEGGKPNQCGWTQDKFGITWQIVPTILPKLLSDPDPAVVNRVTACFMQMTKFDIAELEKAVKS